MNSFYNFKISQKIIGGFFTLIFIFILNAVLGFFTLNQSASIIKETSEIVKPSVSYLNEFNLMVTSSKMYITNWVYLRSNTEDKEALKRLHDVEYEVLKGKINQLKTSWEPAQQQKINAVFQQFDSLLKAESKIMAELASFEDYEDGMKVQMNQFQIDDEILPRSRKIMQQLSEIIDKQKEEDEKADAKLLHSFDNLRSVNLGAGLVIVVIGCFAAFLLTKAITNPINRIQNIIQQLGRGELPQEQNTQFGHDEIGEMALAVNKLVAGLRATSLFAENIGKGNYQAEFTLLSENDVMGNALLTMRSNLAKVAEDDRKRNWTTEGLARFGEILRKNNDNLAKLSDEIISNLVKYTRANQGGLFTINEDGSEPCLELRACYAWDKKKYIEQKIHKGEGLTGQTWLEGETTYMTEVPNDYIQITSGLGEANPRSILIVPLKVNDETYGIVEMASFNEFQPHEIEFVEKIAESIASTVASAKINERTQKLLEESTFLTEQMRAQEEEMRQNMEELQATQEEMQRGQRDTKARAFIFESTQLIAEFDNQYQITYSNSLLQSQLRYQDGELVGRPLELIFDNRQKLEEAKRTLAQGNLWSAMVDVKDKKGERMLVKASAGVVSSEMENEKYLLIIDGIEKLQS